MEEAGCEAVAAVLVVVAAVVLMVEASPVVFATAKGAWNFLFMPVTLCEKAKDKMDARPGILAREHTDGRERVNS